MEFTPVKFNSPEQKKLLEMSLNALEKEYIKKSEEVAKLPEPLTEVREKTVKKGFIREIQTVRIRKESYLKTQLYLIGAMLRKRKREIKQGLRKNQEKKILQHMTVKKEIEKLKQKRGNKNKSKTELFHNLAEKTGKSFDAIKRAFYYKSK